MVEFVELHEGLGLRCSELARRWNAENPDCHVTAAYIRGVRRKLAVDGRRAYVPTPEEIRKRSQQIQQTWSSSERRLRVADDPENEIPVAETRGNG